MGRFSRHTDSRNRCKSHGRSIWVQNNQSLRWETQAIAGLLLTFRALILIILNPNLIRPDLCRGSFSDYENKKYKRGDIKGKYSVSAAAIPKRAFGWFEEIVILGFYSEPSASCTSSPVRAGKKVQTIRIWVFALMRCLS